MPTTLTIRDETTTGDRRDALVIELLTERLSVRELIRSRVYQEVHDFNATLPAVFRGLVQPDDFERTVNGYRRLTGRREIDWKKQFEQALAGFESNGFIVLVNDRQSTSLDDEIVVAPETEVTFVKLEPLVGG